MSDLWKVVSKHKLALGAMFVLSVAFVFVMGLIIGSRNPAVIQTGGAPDTLAEKIEKARLKDVQYSGDHFVEGWVQAKNPADYRAILFIYTDQYYVKPDFIKGEGRELSEVKSDGRFSIRAYHDSAKATDLAASKFAVYLVEKEFGGLKSMNDIQSAAAAAIDRFSADIE